jgi:hypothetical protein
VLLIDPALHVILHSSPILYTVNVKNSHYQIHLPVSVNILPMALPKRIIKETERLMAEP